VKVSATLSRLSLAVVALAASVAVALPAAASGAPVAFAGKGGAAERAVGNGHAAKASKRKRARAHHAAGKKQGKAPSPTTTTGSPAGGTGASSGGGSSSAPTTTTGKTTKPSTGTKTSPSKGTGTTTTPPSTGTTTPPTTTPPATTPPTTTPSSELLFSGSRIRDFALTQAAPGAITEVPDPLGGGEQVMKFTVADRDVAPITPTENPRAQLVSPDIIHSGQEFWLQAKFMIPADLPTIPGWMSLVSVYGAPYAGSSPWCIGIVGNNLTWDRNASYGWDTPWKTPLQRGQWTTVLLHERFAADGFVEMWVNGQPITFFAPGSSYSSNRRTATSHLEMKTMDSSNGGAANSVRISQYREAGMFQTASVYWAGVKVGTTRAAVGG
jgi:hypothetical protein